MSDDPTDIAVGAQGVMLSGVADDVSYSASYTITSGASYVKFSTPAGLNRNPDTAYPYSIKVDGTADGVATMRNRIFAWINGEWVNKCEDTASIRVGSAIVPININPWWQDGDSGLYCVHIYGNIAVCGQLSFTVLIRGINRLWNSWTR
jgi:hypothetical protein